MTGASRLNEAYFAKGFELLHELVPEAASVALLTPFSGFAVNEAEKVTRSLRLRLTVPKISNPNEIEQAFASIVQERSGGLLVDTSIPFLGQTNELVALAARYRVPVIYGFREVVEAGGLMSYGPRLTEVTRIAGNYTARILKGEKPADLPVQLATRIELVINLKTAKALGLAIPETLLATADEVIQ
jgi:putative ABC transport system substrate-binding protein